MFVCRISKARLTPNSILGPPFLFALSLMTTSQLFVQDAKSRASPITLFKHVPSRSTRFYAIRATTVTSFQGVHKRQSNKLNLCPSLAQLIGPDLRTCNAPRPIVLTYRTSPPAYQKSENRYPYLQMLAYPYLVAIRFVRLTRHSPAGHTSLFLRGTYRIGLRHQHRP